jgi:hypothetical protein
VTCAGRFWYPDHGTVWQVTTCAGRGVLVRARGEERPIVLSPPDPEAFVERLHTGTPTTITLPPPDKGPVVALVLAIGSVASVATILVSVLLLLGPSRMRYLGGNGALEVHTLYGRKRWATAGAHARAYTPARMLRLAGTGAPGYFTGFFRESGKTTRVYATALDRVLLFEGEARVILSPEDRVAMLRALEQEGAAIERHAV